MKTNKNLLIAIFILIVPIIIMLYYFLFPRFIFIEKNITPVTKKIANITYELSFTNTLRGKKQNLLFDKRVYGPPFKALLMVKHPSPVKNLDIKNIKVINSKNNIIFEQKIDEDMTFAKQDATWVGSLFCEKKIVLNDTTGVLIVEFSINNENHEISFELTMVETKDYFSLFYAGLSI